MTKSFETAIAATVLWPLSVLWSGFVGSKVWLWFVVSPFSAPRVGIIQFAGLILVVRYLTYRYTMTDEEDALVNYIGSAWLYPALVLAFGFVLHLWSIA